MTSPWNATMHYISLFFYHYHLDRLDLVTLPQTWINKAQKFILGYHPFFNVPRRQAFFLHMAIQLLKNLIVAHGQLRVFPRWVTFLTFPSLVIYYYYHFRIGESPLEWFLNVYHFVLLWYMMIRHRFSLDTQYVFLVWGFTVGEWPLYDRFCLGFQFAINMSIVLILAWFVIQSIWHEHFSLPFIVVACAIFYSNINRGPESSEVFFIFLLILGLGFFGGVLASRGDNGEMMFFLAIASCIGLLLCFNIAVFGFEGPTHSSEEPFSRLPTFDRKFYDDARQHEDLAEVREVPGQGVDGPLTEEELQREHDLMFEEFETGNLVKYHEDLAQVHEFLTQGVDGPLTEEELRWFMFEAFEAANLRIYHEHLEEEHETLTKDVKGPLTLEEFQRKQELMLKEFEAANLMNVPTARIESTSTVSTSMPIEESTTAKPEVESIVFRPDADGAPDLKAGVRVKYRSNETMLLF